MARETATYLHCDYHGCNVTVPVNDEAPDGWYKVFSANEGRYQRDYWEFHSLRCIERWSEERRKAAAPTTTIVYTNGAAATAAPTAIDMVRDLFASDASAILTSRELRELTGRTQTVVDGALGRLVNEGYLERSEEVPRKYWLSVPDEA